MTDRRAYFDDAAKGEVGLLKKEFRACRTTAQTREAVKRAIAFMTMGIDVSPLLPEMIMAVNTHGIVVKKMVYLYLSRFAAREKDTALLVVNTLRKDCIDENPTIRGLALRTFSSLGLPSIVEYLIPLLKNALKDVNPYVRKTGVLALVKLYRLSPQSVRGAGMLNKLYAMVSDKDPQVSANCIRVLNEMLAAEGGIALNKAMVHHLLNRLRDFDEWSVAEICDSVARYVPEDEDEVFGIFNMLDDRLKHLNSAVVISACKVFLQLAKRVPELRTDIYERLKEPLFTLVTGACPEIAFAVLCHVLVMVQRAPEVFAPNAHMFFCRYNDPFYIKRLKLDIVTLVATNENVEAILQEMSVYVSDIDRKLGQLAVQSVAKIAVTLEESHERITHVLMGFLDLELDHITTTTVTVMKDILRKYPERAGDVVPGMKRTISQVDTDEGKEALIWMLGEYGEHIWESPYILEDMVEQWELEKSHVVRLALLTSVMRLFFKRPPECRGILEQLLSVALADTDNQDVHDRALFYFRLLSASMEEASRVVNTAPPPVGSAAMADANVREAVFNEFNTLAVVFGKPAAYFLRFVPKPFMRHSDDSSESPRREAIGGVGDEGDEEEEAGDAVDVRVHGAVSEAIGRRPVQQPVDLISTDLLDLGIASPSDSITLVFPPNPGLSPQQFQDRWLELASARAGAVETRLSHAVEASVRGVEHLMHTHQFAHIASGTIQRLLKFYFYAQESSGSYCYVELVIDTDSRKITGTIRADFDRLVDGYAHLVRSVFQ